MKNCRCCGIDKEENDFLVKDKKTGRRDTVCRKCQSLRVMQWAKNNREKAKINRYKYKKKLGKFCMICGSQPLIFGNQVCSLQCLIHSKSKKLDNGCWEWMGIVGNSGYGKTCKNGRGAHRISYEAFKGSIPDAMQVMHICDNKKCVNPEHLKIATCKENIQDYIKKYGWHSQRRFPYFEKYTLEDAKKCWEMRKKDLTWKGIGLAMKIPPMSAKMLYEKYEKVLNVNH